MPGLSVHGALGSHHHCILVNEEQRVHFRFRCEVSMEDVEVRQLRNKEQPSEAQTSQEQTSSKSLLQQEVLLPICQGLEEFGP